MEQLTNLLTSPFRLIGGIWDGIASIGKTGIDTVLAPFKVGGSTVMGVLDGAVSGAKPGAMVGLVAGGIKGFMDYQDGKDVNFISSAIGGAFSGAFLGAGAGASVFGVRNLATSTVSEIGNLGSNIGQIGSNLIPDIPPNTPNPNVLAQSPPLARG